MTLDDYLELVGRAGYIVIHEDDLKALAAGKKNVISQLGL